MFIIKLGLRNLFRHKKRTLITAVIISLAIFIYLIVDSLMVGITELSFTNIIKLDSGHIQICRPAYWEEREEVPLKNLINVKTELEKEITGLDNYQSHTVELNFSARLNNGIDELPITGLGIKPQEYLEVLKLDDYFIEGSMLDSGEYQAVMGKALADLMDVKLGDYITLITRTEGGTFNTIDARIKGLLKTPDPTINESTVYLPIGIVRQALNIENKVSQLKIRLDTGKHQAPAVVDSLNQKFEKGGLDVKAYSWKDSAGDVIAMSRAQQVESSAVLGIILLIAAVGIINTTILGALERMEEIGMMKALGMKEKEIVFAFMVEAAGIGIIGGLIGWFLSAFGVGYLTQVGVPLAELGSDFNYGMPIVDTIYGAWSPGNFIFIFVFGVVVAVLSSILPALWAARKNPVKSIYHR
ncbi:MAG: ABC transporter permease [Halothermotrichaceae bacterium]